MYKDDLLGRFKISTEKKQVNVEIIRSDMLVKLSFFNKIETRSIYIRYI